MKNLIQFSALILVLLSVGCISVPKTEIVERDYSAARTEGVVRYSVHEPDLYSIKIKESEKLMADYCSGNFEKVSIKKSNAVILSAPFPFFEHIDVTPQEEVKFRCKK